MLAFWEYVRGLERCLRWYHPMMLTRLQKKGKFVFDLRLMMLSRVMLRLTMHDGVSTVGSHCDWSPRRGLSRGLRESNLIWSWREGLGGVVFINRILCQLWISCTPHYFWILGYGILRWLDFISRNFLRRVLLFKGSLRLHHCDREPLRLAYCSCRCLLLNIVGTVHGKIYHCWAKVWFLSGFWRQGLR